MSTPGIRILRLSTRWGLRRSFNTEPIALRISHDPPPSRRLIEGPQHGRVQDLQSFHLRSQVDAAWVGMEAVQEPLVLARRP
jgi:hypothetical protein